MDNNLDEKKLTPEQRAAKAPDAAVQKKTIKDRLISAFRTGMPKNKKVVAETIRKVDGGYRLVAGSGRNLGTYPTKGGAEKREKQVNYFKHMGEDKKRQVEPPPEAMPSDTRIKPLPKKGKRTTGSFNKFGNFTPGMKEEAEQIDEITITNVTPPRGLPGKSSAEMGKEYRKAVKKWNAENPPGKYDPEEHMKKVLANLANLNKEEVEQIDEISKDTVTKYKTKATNVKRALPSLKREFQRKIEKAEALAAQHSPGGKLPRGVGRNPAIAAKAREEAAKAKKSLAVFDRWETNRTKGLERAEKRLAKEEVEQIDELSKQRASELSARAKKHQNMGDEAKNKGDFETANRHYNHADKIYSHMINRSMVATRKNLADMKKMRGELGEGISAVNRALGFTPYSVLNPPPKRKPGLLKKIKNKIKDKLKIYEAVRKPEHTHAVVRQGNILSYHTSLKSAHKRADNLDQKYGATVHTVKPL